MFRFWESCRTFGIDNRGEIDVENDNTVPMIRLFINCWDLEEYADIGGIEVGASTCATVAMLALKGFTFLDADEETIFMFKDEMNAAISVATGEYDLA